MQRLLEPPGEGDDDSVTYEPEGGIGYTIDQEPE